MTDRRVHYEISSPVFNKKDGHYYQRVRQVDDQGNLVGIGDQLKKLPNPDSRDGETVPGVDLSKLGRLAGDSGQIVFGVAKKDARMLAKGAISFAKDLPRGIFCI